MSLNIYFDDPTATYRSTIHDQNITHNLGEMAEAAGIYYILWHPKDNGITTAAQLIDPLHKAITDMRARPEYYKQFNSPNGWGIYEDFITWLDELLNACQKYPKALISIGR